MAEVGTYYITVMPSMNKFTGAVKSALGDLGTTAGNQFSGGFMDVLKGSALGTMIGNLATKLGSELIAGFDVGIKRLDTLENFPRVMEALGFSARDAADSVKLIMEHLDGLPTTTQDMVTLTQAIADSTGDLDLATRAALGFNDMMLANGASAGEMTQAMGVFNRVLGKGNATTAQWMSLQSVMPAQLALVARELMGEEASVEGLRDALNDGEISWDDFLKAIVRLDEEGTEHVASFAEQARANSHGIGTSLTNIQNRIGQGWAEILDVFGRENISGTIDTMSYGIRDAMYVVADALEWVKYTILGTNIDENIRTICENIMGAFGGIDTSMLKELARGFIDLVDGALQWIVDHGEEVGTILAMIAGAVAAIVGFKLAMWFIGVQTAVSAFVSSLSLINVIGTGVIGLIAALVVGLVYFFTQTETGKKIWSDFVNALKELWTNLKEEFTRAFDQIKQNLEVSALAWQNFKQRVVEWTQETKQKVIATWNSIRTKLANTVSAIKNAMTNAWNAIKNAVTRVVNAIKSFLTGSWDSIKNGTTQKFTALKTGVLSIWNGLKSGISTVVNGIKSFLTGSWDTIKSTATQKMTDLKTGVTDKFEAVRSGVKQKIDDLKSAAAERWESMRSTARQKMEDLKLGVVEKFSYAKTTAQQRIEDLKSAAEGKWESIRKTARLKVEDMKLGVIEKFGAVKSKAAERVQDVWNTITGTWGNLASTVSGIFEEVKNAITSPLETAKGLVSSAIDTIKSYFDTTISFPHINLPHFHVSGGVAPWGLGGKGEPPSFWIEWYKRGGVFSSPTIIGVGEGSSSEAVLPLNERTYRAIARGIASETSGAAGGVLVTGNNFYVRSDEDIDLIAEAINRKVNRERWAKS